MAGTYQQYLAAGGKASQDAYNANVLKNTGSLPPGASSGSGSVLTGGAVVPGDRSQGSRAYDLYGGQAPTDMYSTKDLPAGVTMVNVPGFGKIRSDTVFEGDNSGYGGNIGQTRTAADMANIMASGNFEADGSSGYVTDRNGDESWQIGKQNFKSAAAPAPVAAPAGPRPRSAAPAAPRQTPATPGAPTPVEVTPEDPFGFDKTILTKPQKAEQIYRPSIGGETTHSYLTPIGG